MKKLAQLISIEQIGALLRKDLLVRWRQPWMTILQFAWPVLIFIALYTVRNRFQPEEIPACQFPTRQLPSKGHVLPLFHSYICSLDNECTNPDNYTEITTFNEAPLKPILNIAQTLINENALYDALVNLPEKANFVTAVTSIVRHAKFKYIEENVNDLVRRIPAVEKALGASFNIKNLFADDQTFSQSGKIICGKAFPRSKTLRLVNRIFYTEDFKDPNDDEIEDMPTPYCKQLYLDVTSHNRGKITWKFIKPILRGKILYGPQSDTNDEIIKLANQTFEEMNKIRTLARALDTSFTKLRTDAKFNESFFGLLDLVKTPLVQSLLGGHVDVASVEGIMRAIATDQQIANIIRTVADLLECFSVDRFIPVESAKALEERAYEMNEKKLFYAGIYFDQTAGKQVEYTLRMEIDNSPITNENTNRFWFPGPDASLRLDMRYHRGMVQIKHALDVAIIKYKKNAVRKSTEELKAGTITSTTESDIANFDHFTEDFEEMTEIKTDSSETTTSGSGLIDAFLSMLGGSFDTPVESEEGNGTSQSTEKNNSESDIEDFLNFSDKIEVPIIETTAASIAINSQNASKADDQTIVKFARVKRSPQFGELLSLFLSGGGSTEEISEIDRISFYTKQFPYPKWTRDDFKKGLYLAQSIQMAFFIALLVQVSNCVRYRIWMKESKNTMIMRSMGLKSLSEIITWSITTFIELILIFLVACIILYAGGILQYTNFFFLLFFLITFGICVISFCYMCSTIFSSASIGSVSSSIFFLMTFLPFIIIISLDIGLSDFLKFLTNLSFSTAFCYAWGHIMRLELQDIGMSFSQAFFGDPWDDDENSFRYAFFMILLDTLLYAVIGFFIERLKNDEYKFHIVPRDKLADNVGAVVQNTSKVYDNSKVAVSNVSLVVLKSHITCLLGRNGSGKSTIIKMLTGQTKPTTGRISLSQLLHDDGTLDTIGFCSQDNVLLPLLTAKEHLELYARIKLKTGFEFEVQKTMKSLNFRKYENYPAYQLSGGYKRRLCIAIAFIGSPNLVILDEPCSGVDTKARRCVWELIEKLRKDRAVLLATHYLDEAEYLSDTIAILNEGKIISQRSPEGLKDLFTKTFDVTIQIQETSSKESLDYLKNNIRSLVDGCKILEETNHKFKITVPYKELSNSLSTDTKTNRSLDLVSFLEEQKQKQIIETFYITSKNLDEIFNNLYHDQEHMNGSLETNFNRIEYSKIDQNLTKETLTHWEIVKNLLWKRFLHFRRNYRLLLCILVLPTIFEMIAMGFLLLRPGGEHDNKIELNRNMYFGSKQFLSMERAVNLTTKTWNDLKMDCYDCMEFDNSKNAFRWILDTHNEYKMNRYGSISFNESTATVWFNNKGYHSMMAWLNDLNSNILKAEMHDHSYGITAYNHPIKLGDKELSESSILQQVADAGVSLILLIAFSLVSAGACVFIVNERVNGEKLQQKLCGVKYSTYWGVAFFWDFIVYLSAVLLCVIVFAIFSIPVYVDRSNLDGIVLLLVLFGFAIIPAVHVFEKLFTESSIAYMGIFCMNVILALTTLTVILLFDILGESDESEKWRNFFDGLFLIFPQYALSDGLIQICQNYIVFQVFSRFDIDAYKDPIRSKMLHRHFVSLFMIGLIFMAVNCILESDILRKLKSRYLKEKSVRTELQIISIQNSLKRDDKFSSCNGNVGDYALKVENVCMAYQRNDYAVQNVSFVVKTGECFGLLGNNGAGKSTMFSILSGQMRPNSGTVEFFDNNISYCPQTSALDSLLSVKEVIEFYGSLRRVVDIQKLTVSTLKSFHLDDYKNVLVKNLSGGNRRKLNVAVSCFGDTSVVLMDEPTSDMDPVTRSLVYRAINELVDERRSVVMTSHTISEIDRVCHRIGILKDGKLLSTGSPNQLENQFGGYYIVTIYEENIDKVSMERDIKCEFPQCVDLFIHSHSLKCLIKVKGKQNNNENTVDGNTELNDDSDDLSLGELFTKLNKFCSDRNISYTISKCHLDKIFELIMESGMTTDEIDANNRNGSAYTDNGYKQSETTT